MRAYAFAIFAVVIEIGVENSPQSSSLRSFPNGKHDDQVDSVSQALSWVRARYMGPHMGLFWYYKERYDEAVARGDVEPDPRLADWP